MTPREFSPATVTKRLILLRELLDDLTALGAVTAAQLQDDRLRRRALERILTQLVEIAADINQHVAASLGSLTVSDYRGSFEAMGRLGVLPGELADALKRSVGMRNVLTHEYVNVDLELVAQAVGHARENYGAYVRAVADWLKKQE